MQVRRQRVVALEPFKCEVCRAYQTRRCADCGQHAVGIQRVAGSLRANLVDGCRRYHPLIQHLDNGRLVGDTLAGIVFDFNLVVSDGETRTRGTHTVGRRKNASSCGGRIIIEVPIKRVVGRILGHATHHCLGGDGAAIRIQTVYNIRYHGSLRIRYYRSVNRGWCRRDGTSVLADDNDIVSGNEVRCRWTRDPQRRQRNVVPIERVAGASAGNRSIDPSVGWTTHRLI